MQSNINRYSIILVLIVGILSRNAQGHRGWGGRGRGHAMRRPMAASVKSAACQTCKQTQQPAASPTIINHIIVNGDGQTERKSLEAARDLTSQASGNQGQNNHNNQYTSQANHANYGDKLSGVAGALSQALGGGAGGGLVALAAGGTAQALSDRLGGGQAGAGGQVSGRALINGLVRNLGHGGTGGGHGGQLGSLGALGAAALEEALARRRNGGGEGSGGITGHLEGRLPDGHNGHQQTGGHQLSGRGSEAHLLPGSWSGPSHHGEGHQHFGGRTADGSEHYAEHQQHGANGFAGYGADRLSYESGGSGLHHHEAVHGSRESHHGSHERPGSYEAVAPGQYPRGDLGGEHHSPAVMPRGDIRYGSQGQADRRSAAGFYEQDGRNNGRGGAHVAGGHKMAQGGMNQVDIMRPTHHEVGHPTQEYEFQRGYERGHERGYETLFESGRGREHGSGYEQGHEMDDRAIDGGHPTPAGYKDERVPYGHRRGHVSAGGQYEAEFDGDDQGEYEFVDEYGVPLVPEPQGRPGGHGKYAAQLARGLEEHGARSGARGAHGQFDYIDPKTRDQYSGAEDHRGRKALLDPSRLERLGGTYLKGLGLNGRPAREVHGGARLEAARRNLGGHRDNPYQAPAREPANYRGMETRDYPASAAASASAASRE